MPIKASTEFFSKENRKDSIHVLNLLLLHTDLEDNKKEHRLPSLTPFVETSVVAEVNKQKKARQHNKIEISFLRSIELYQQKVMQLEILICSSKKLVRSR